MDQETTTSSEVNSEVKIDRRKKEHRTPKPEYATVEQFNQVFDLVRGIAQKLEAGQEKVKDDSAPVTSKEHPLPFIPVDPNVRKEINDIFGPELGPEIAFDITYNGGVPIFNLYIPLDKSNAKPEYLEMHHIDKRSASIAPGAYTVREWCLKVRNNLSKPRG